ncbi:MAG: ABC transporter ATP-binding protein/permease [Actinomycetota bacterium]|nr:ABC transporter ATP-binding protein/permease [Actinomycetota bacterium]
MQQAAEKPRSTLDTLADLLRRYPRRFAYVVLLLLGAGLAEGVGLLSLLPVLNIVSGEKQPGEAGTIGTALERVGLRPTIGVLLLLVVAALLVRGAVVLAALRQAGYMGADVASDLRRDLIRSVIRARWEYFVHQPVGALSNAASIEAMRASQICIEGSYLLANALQVLIYLTIASLVSPLLTVGAIVFGLLLFGTLRSLVSATRRAGLRETEVLTSLLARLADSLSAIKPLKAMGREGALGPVMDREVEELNQAMRHQALTRAALPAVQEPAIAAALAVGIFIALRNTTVEFAELLFLAVIFQRTASRIGNVQSYYQSTAGLQGAYWSIRDAISSAETQREADRGQRETRLRTGITFDQVSFAYGPHLILDRIDEHLPAHAISVILGPSGTGKTTLLDLMSGLLMPTAGRVLVDDVPLPELSLQKWRDSIGYVPQEMTLLHDTVYLNVTMSDPSISREDARRALERAGAWEFVADLPEGLDTRVGERGTRFSGGQRQRLALARAIVRNPLLLLLDEATAALDPESERKITSTLRALKEEMTIVAVSHQPAIAEIADAVFHLTGGRLIGAER